MGMETYYRACVTPQGARKKGPGWAPRAKRPYIVVVVDDEPDFCTVVGELLKSQNLVVHAAYGALEGLSLIESVRPDLVLTDVMMPQVNGLELIRRLRADPVLGQVPTVVVSALVKREDQEAALSAGADAFIAKPCSVQQLRETIAHYLY
jgi:CheY-like chemotaxis protein